MHQTDGKGLAANKKAVKAYSRQWEKGPGLCHSPGSGPSLLLIAVSLSELILEGKWKRNGSRIKTLGCVLHNAFVPRSSSSPTYHITP
jgi:hypothetical protein